MSRPRNLLSKRRLAALEAAKAPGYYLDGEGLWLQITKRGSASWIFWWTRDGVRRKLGLGPLSLVTIEEA
jgi:hypothetical protein